MPFIFCVLLLVGVIFSLTKCSSDSESASSTLGDAATTLGSTVSPLMAEGQATLSQWAGGILEKPLAAVTAGLALSPITPVLDARNLMLGDNLPKCDVLIEQAISVLGLHHEISALAAQKQIEAVLAQGVHIGCFVQKTSLNLLTNTSPR
ncbi:MAG: hypothetical protein Q7S87_01125 [Agitococcus sp.]|nr:hypothetical protein [Agitococcus sp.]